MRGWLTGLLCIGFVAACLVAIVASVAAIEMYKRAKISLLRPVETTIFAAENRRVPRHTHEAGGPPRIVLIGDSRVSHWSSFGAAFNWQVLNRGVAGETVAQLAYRFEQDALDLDPDIIVLQSGGNDLIAASLLHAGEAQAVVDETGHLLQDLAEKAARRGVSVILTTIIPPAKPSLLRRMVWNDAVRSYVIELNAKLAAWSAPERVVVLDLTPIVGRESLLPAFRLDTVHLNEQAYAALSARLADEIAAIVEARHPSQSPSN